MTLTNYLGGELMPGHADAPETYVNALAALFDKLGAGFISGFRLKWETATSVSVSPGTAQLPSGGLIISVSTITIPGISLGANAWGHVYLYNNAGVPGVEVSTTPPVGYFGQACQKSGDSTRRYLGSFRTDGSGNIMPQRHYPPGFARYENNISGSPNRVLTAGAATAETTVNCQFVVPASGRVALFRVVNTSNQHAYIGSSEDNIALSGAAFIDAVELGAAKTLVLPMDSAQSFTYMLGASPASGGLYADCIGYWFDR